MNALKEVKKKHLLMILEDLFIHESSTMNELIHRLPLSQPSIRNMVRFLQEKKDIIEVGNDTSSGGRCPTRFAFNPDRYCTLCLYVQNDSVKILNQKETNNDFQYDNQKELIDIILNLIHDYQPHCCAIAVQGIVKDSTYITDHHNDIEVHRWLYELQQKTTIPLYLQNDVKMMHLGKCYSEHNDHTFYLHINHVGVGSSYIYQDMPLYGASGYMGEIGLIPIDGISINQRIRDCQSQQEFNDLLYLMFCMILTMFDPYEIHLSIDTKWIYDESILMVLKDRLSFPFQCKIHYHNDFVNLLFEGLQYIAIQNLMKERIEKYEESI